MKKILPILCLFSLQWQAFSADKIKKVALIGIDGVGYAELMKAICVNPVGAPQWMYPGYQRSLFIDLNTWLPCSDADQKSMVSRFPNLRSLNIYPSNMGGTPGITSHVGTVSGPGWSTNLTGTWAWKHGITDNSMGKKVQVPTIFNYIAKASLPNFNTAFVYDWNVLHDLTIDELPLINWQSNYTDNCIADPNPPVPPTGKAGDKNCAFEDAQDSADALTQINDSDLGFLFAYFTFADDWSHQYMQDTTDNFLNAARVDLDHAESIINGIKSRPNYNNEDWLIIVTTDHGRNIVGGHGGDTLPEKLPFVALNKDKNTGLNDELLIPVANDNMVSDLKKNLVYSADYELYQYKNIDGAANQTDIVPSILSYLNIPINNFNFDGSPFLGPVGVRKLYANNYNYNPLQPHTCTDISWITPTTPVISASQYNIYRDGVLINPAPVISIVNSGDHGTATTKDCSLPLANDKTNYTIEFSPSGKKNSDGTFPDGIYTNTKLWTPSLK